MAKVPQVYLYGVIDAEAPRRFATLMKEGRIRPGSDVYLNATGGDLDAALALGRLFRSGSMATHLGTPRPPRRTKSFNRPATCAGVCAYAYLGGLYRWAPTGGDRIGFPTYPAQQIPEEIAAFLKQMEINPNALVATGPVAGDPVEWMSADQMIAKDLANNGRLHLIATYRQFSGAPFLELKQKDRAGEHRITLLCKRDGADLTTYDTVGTLSARNIMARSARSYFEINQQQTLPEEGGATIDDGSVVIHRLYPLAQLSRIASAQAMGAWVSDRKGVFRYGFAFEVDGVKKILNDFYQACSQYAPWSAQWHS